MALPQLGSLGLNLEFLSHLVAVVVVLIRCCLFGWVARWNPGHACSGEVAPGLHPKTSNILPLRCHHSVFEFAAKDSHLSGFEDRVEEELSFS